MLNIWGEVQKTEKVALDSIKGVNRGAEISFFYL